MEHLILLNFLTLAIAISAFTYSNILTDTGMILDKVNKWLEGLINGRFRWVYNILIGCQYCVAGQWALWYFIYFILSHHTDYHLEYHIWFIMQTIFLVKIITWFYYEVLETKLHYVPESPVQLPSSLKQLTQK